MVTAAMLTDTVADLTSMATSILPSCLALMAIPLSVKLAKRMISIFIG